MNIYEYFAGRDDSKRILESSTIKVGGSTDGFNQLLIISDFYSSNKSILVVLPTLYAAQRYYDVISNAVDSEDVLFFPADELVSSEMISATGDFLFERIQTLYTLLDGKKRIVITNFHGAIKYEMNKDLWIKSCFKLEIDGKYDINKLVNDLSKSGYEPVYTVTKTGEFSRRGEIVDIFPLGYINPIRIDFFDDEIETIKEFDTETQRSISKLDYVNILPVSEFIYGEEEFELAKRKILGFIDNFELSQIEEDMYKRDLEDLSLHKNLSALSRYLEFFDNSKTSLFDFCDNKRVYLIDPKKSEETYQRLILDLNESCGRMSGYSMASMDIFKNYKDIEKCGNVFIEGVRDIGGTDINVFAKDIVPYGGNRKVVLSDIAGYRVVKKLVIALENEDRRAKLSELLDEDGLFLTPVPDCSKIAVGQINYVKADVPSVELVDMVILNHAAIFESQDKHKVKGKYKSIYKNAQKISRYDELESGDYVVHYDYGVGKYIGIETLELQGIKRDVLSIEYGNKTALYIPLEQISDIMKYASADTLGVKVNTIGDAAWARAKARARKKVHDISEKLIALYGARMKSEGFEYPADSAEQAQFEADFEYDLTMDQAKAINDVKHDMESKKPMDRLICGDVGYGKTEVALRAAFKAVYGGKQAAVLAPTTILVRQHYNNFKNRMEEYGIKVVMLSRFVPKKEQDKIIEQIKSGEADVIVGTHRLLSKEIVFKDLGLLIVDEEQRFGVTHKERIKEMKVNVDCITLSATPIPRTLQMSMMGIKDLSMIETPPKNRYPIQTYVIERNDRIITDAIERELARGGQVFYLYNRVDDIEEVAAHIHSLVPEARICVGHGKLSKDKLEDMIAGYIDKKYDVLMCTTIIETGIDMPDTNTLIIHDADKLGLAQMYQIRGRVGRSSKIAYAYLMYEPRKMLTPDAEKRLATIKEFNELGSGFKIAMRDLSIRGSGDILGEEQSGFVETIGIDMYLKILEEEMNKTKEEANPNKEEPKEKTKYAAVVNRTIPESYISNDDTRIKIHKKIDKLESLDQMNDLIKELTDRFGEPGEELVIYMKEKVMGVYADMLGVDRIQKADGYRIKLTLPEEISRRQDGMFIFTEGNKIKALKLEYNKGVITFVFDLSRNKNQVFDQIIHFFDILVEHNKTFSK
ncbi:MAG: transcription-repair coupling factor [Acholeplasmatales bacterium]|nr:transcription-repair coupling factor [Acholeplasmatales bacterium]